MGTDFTSSLPLHARIRIRREAQGLTGQDLAERAGVSPSYISLIEKGVKVPGEEVAEAIARALGDDPELYRAWARAGRHDDWLSAYRDMTRAVEYSSDPTARRRIISGEDLEFGGEAVTAPTAQAKSERPALGARGIAARLFRTSRGKPAESEVAAPPLVEVPVLREGDDPGDGTTIPASAPIDVLRLDPRMLGGTRPVRPFAYRVGPDGAPRVRGELRPGDWAVLTSRAGRIHSGAVYAVRLRGRVVLSRAAVKGNALLLPPSEGRSDFELLEIDRPETLTKVVAGRMVLSIRGSGRD